MAKRENVKVTNDERLQHDKKELNLHNSSFAPYIDKMNQHKSEKSFAEIVNEQATRLPALSSSTLPLSMKEILKNSSPQTTRWTPRLPTIPAGQVQLVHGATNDSKMARKEKRRLKRERKKGHRKHDSSRSHVQHDDSDDDINSQTWKKKLHQREKKRLIDEGESTLGLSRELRLPTFQEINKW